MSAIGPKRTSLVALHMSAFGGNADIKRQFTTYSTLGKSGHRAAHSSLGSTYYFFIIIIVGHETTAAARWALLLIVRAFSMTPSPLQSGQVFMGPSVTEDHCAIAGHRSLV